ncbi:MAG: tetratricopeptide repeat protein [Candidatus Dormiibacterota bacterium]
MSKTPAGKKPASKKAVTSKSTIAALPDPRSMEGYLRALGGRSPDGALNKAQDLMYQAWEAREQQQSVALARRAIKISPLCADAYVLLAERASTSLEEEKKLYELGVKAGETALGPDRFREYAGHFWGFLETRPYMRARAGLAQALWAEGHHSEAVRHYREMLSLNPGDNQGIRYLLAACLLHMQDDAGLERLLKQQEDDGSAYMVYTRALMAFRRTGTSQQARKLAEEAWHSNVHIPVALCGAKKVKDPGTGYYTMGGEDEAAYYLDEYGFAWRDTPGAIAWLVEETKNMKLRSRRSDRLH